MTDQRSPIDKLFDVADSVLDKAEAVLKPDVVPPRLGTPNPKGRPPMRGLGEAIESMTLSRDWQKVWDEEIWWSPVAIGGLHVWHAFESGSVHTICNPDVDIQSNLIVERQKLPHGKVIPGCTSCIIGVSHRG